MPADTGEAPRTGRKPDAASPVAASRAEARTRAGAGAQPAAGADPRRWLALVAVSLSTLMGYLDNNIMNVALPTIQRSLHLSVPGLEWVVSAYLLTLAGLLLAGGRIADVYGRRRLFLTGLVVFTGSSLVAGLSGSAGLLIGSRAVQGIGAALLMPTALAIIMATFTSPRERASAIGVWTAVGAAALGLGPAIGGLISEHLHWGWIFLINVPIGVIAFVIGIAAVRESRASSATRLDLPGLASSAFSLLALTYALIEGAGRGWTSAVILGAFGAAALAFVTFLIVELRSEHPMVDLAMFRNRHFSGGTGTMMIWAFGILGIYFFTSLYLQDLLGFSPVKAGLAFVPMAAALVVMAAAAPRVAALIGEHRSVAVAMLGMTLSLLLIVRIGLGAGLTAFLPGFILFGAASGLMNVPLTTSVMAAVPQQRAGVASALLNNSRELAGLFGITVIGAVIRGEQSSALRGGADQAHAFLAGYHTGLWVTVGLTAAGAVVSYLTLRPHSRERA